MIDVSVLVPTYHRPEFLARALDSIAAQDFSGSYEAVVVHDGDDVAFGTAFHYQPFPCTFAVQPHAGLSATVNRAFELSKGRYVTVLADDDVIRPMKLRVMHDYLERSHLCDVVYGLAERGPDPLRQGFVPSNYAAFLGAHPTINSRPDDTIWIHGTATMYRREAWERVGGYDLKDQRAEEYRMHERMLCAGVMFHGLDVVTDGYCQHDEQKSVTRTMAHAH